MRAKLLLMMVAFVFGTSSSVNAQGGAPVRVLPGVSAVDSMMAAEFARDSVGSITVGIVSQGMLVWTKSYGYADIATHRPANRETVYRIGSITKMFTAVMLQQLVAKGTMHLSDPMSRFVPEINRVRGHPSPAPTLLQFATMTSGLAAEPDSQGSFGSGAANTWETKTLAALASSHFESQPGARYSYSNIGFATLGLAVERAAKMPYDRWEQQRILDPLGMQHTVFDAAAVRGEMSTGYEVTPDGATSTEVSSRERQTGRGYRLPIGAIFTTVDDLSRFMAFEMGHGPESVLAHATLDSAFSGFVATSPDMDVGYGLGFMSQRRGDFPWVGHSGGVPGYSAMLYFDRDHQLGVITFRNATGGKVRLSKVTSDALRTLILAKLEAAKPAK